MNLLLTGIFMGALLFVAFAILVEKLPKWLKQLVLGHHLASDIIFTVLSFLAFPVVGAATLISAGVFCILISLYLMWRRSTQPYTRITLGGITLLRLTHYGSSSKE